MTAVPDFETLHADRDPFRYHGSWYESRKRAVLLAALPRQRYERGWELGCSNGVLSAALATRCDTLLATDLSAAAIMQARQALATHPTVRVEQARHPDQMPAGPFELIVCSEMGYYLSCDQLRCLAGGIRDALARDGLLVGCHWNVPFSGRMSESESVHRLLGQDLHQAFQYHDADFLLQGWTWRPQSVAAMEGRR